MSRKTHFLNFLATLQNGRRSNDTLVQWMGETCFAWHQTEMEALLAEINIFRLEGGFPALEMADLKRTESCASGHSDYTQKLALYASELSASAATAVRR